MYICRRTVYIRLLRSSYTFLAHDSMIHFLSLLSLLIGIRNTFNMNIKNDNRTVNYKRKVIIPRNPPNVIFSNVQSLEREFHEKGI